MTQINLAAAVIPALLLMWFFHKQDLFPEPPRVIWASFGLGILSTLPVIVLGMTVMGPLDHIAHPILYGLGNAFLGAAIPEEAVKYLVVVFYAMRHSAFDEPMDGLVYGVAASMGFAALENVLYVSMDPNGLSVAIMRALTAVPAHAMFGAVMGFFLGLARFEENRRALFYVLAYLVPTGLHGLYDWPLMMLDVTDPYLNPALPANLLMMALAVLIGGFVWAVALARRVRKDQLKLQAAQQQAAPTAGC